MGKHPAAPDFLKLGVVDKRGAADPLLASFSRWLDNGYSRYGGRSRDDGPYYSWRFFARGPHDGFICGILKQSRDRVGRPYPLMILGSGMVSGWRRNWRYLPYACEHTWNEMEWIGRDEPYGLEAFRESLRRIEPPVDCWETVRKQHAVLNRKSTPGTHAYTPSPCLGVRLNALFSPYLREDRFTLKIGGAIQDGAPYVLTHIFSFISDRTPDPPAAAFFNGPPDSLWLAYSHRQLSSAVFRQVWCLAPQEAEGRS